jgi:hypothetical protein
MGTLVFVFVGVAERFIRPFSRARHMCLERAPRRDHLLAKRREARVARDREKKKSAGLKSTVRGDIVERAK